RLVDLAASDDPVQQLITARDSKASLILVDHADRLTTDAQRAALAELINSCATTGRGLILATPDPAVLTGVLPEHHLQLHLAPVSTPIPTGAHGVPAV